MSPHLLLSYLLFSTLCTFARFSKILRGAFPGFHKPQIVLDCLPKIRPRIWKLNSKDEHIQIVLFVITNLSYNYSYSYPCHSQSNFRPKSFSQCKMLTSSLRASTSSCSFLSSIHLITPVTDHQDDQDDQGDQDDQDDQACVKSLIKWFPTVSSPPPASAFPSNPSAAWNSAVLGNTFAKCFCCKCLQSSLKEKYFCKVLFKEGTFAAKLWKVLSKESTFAKCFLGKVLRESTSEKYFSWTFADLALRILFSPSIQS